MANNFSVQHTNLENFVMNVVPSPYVEPDNQRPHKNAGAGEFLAFLIYWVVKAKEFAGNVATALPGCTIVSEGMKPIMMSVSIRNGRVYIQDGQHRYYWSINFFDDHVIVPQFTGNMEVDKIIAEYKCVGKYFSLLDRWMQDAIKNALVTLEVVVTDDEGVEKVLFDDKNRGSSLKTPESMNNNFFNVPIYQELTSGIEQILSETTKDSFNLVYTDGVKYLADKFSATTLFHLVTRCMTVDTATSGAKNIDTEAMTMNASIDQKKAHKIVENVLKSLCLGANIVGHGRAVNTYAGAYLYAITHEAEAKKLNKRENRFLMNSEVFYWEAQPAEKKPSISNNTLLNNTTHSKSNVKYAACQISKLAAKVVK